jgi:hypothetical protein
LAADERVLCAGGGGDEPALRSACARAARLRRPSSFWRRRRRAKVSRSCSSRVLGLGSPSDKTLAGTASTRFFVLVFSSRALAASPLRAVSLRALWARLARARRRCAEVGRSIV